MRPWSVSEQTRLLVVAPHPDDETLGCGLLLQQVLAAGGQVRVLLITDGDNNPWPQRYLERRLRIDDSARRRWGIRRREEVVCALERLGASAATLQPLGWHDMTVTQRLRDEPAAAVAAVRAAIEAFGPTLVCAPALRDRHPDHGAAHVLCRLALAGLEPAPTLLAYPVHEAADPGDYPLSIDARAGQQQRKLAALAEHATQMALSGRRMLRLAESPERYKQAAVAEQGDRLPWRPPLAFRPWLRLLLATPEGTQEWAWPHAPVVRDGGAAFRLQWSGEMPAFVKLYLDWPSPWIFDHWGWWEVTAPRSSDRAA